MTGKYKLLTRIQQKVESPKDQYPFQRKQKKKNYTSTNSKKEKKKKHPSQLELSNLQRDGGWCLWFQLVPSPRKMDRLTSACGWTGGLFQEGRGIL